MKRSLTKLEQKVDYFCKLAGLVEVPPKLLKEVQDWAICYYAKKMLDGFDVKLSTQKMRIEKHQMWSDFSKEWDQAEPMLYKFAYSKGDDQETWQQFQSWMNKRQRWFIPYFDADAVDSKTNLYGVIDSTKGPIISLALYVNKDGSCNFDFSIPRLKHPLIEGGNVIPFFTDENNVSPDRVREIIKENMDSIVELIRSFNTAVRYFEIYSPESIKNLYMQRAQLAKIADKDCPSKNTFKVPVSFIKDVAESAIDPNLGVKDHVTFDAVFETSRRNRQDDYLGLWSATNRSSPHIGTVYIYHNTLQDIADLGKDLQSIFEEGATVIKDTVRHELIHFLQTAIFKLKKLKEWGGLPSRKIRDKSVDFHGNPMNVAPTTPTDTRIRHELRDVEFYTRLSDTVQEFARSARHFPTALHPVLAKIWLGELSFEAAKEFTLQWYVANRPQDNARDSDNYKKILDFDHTYEAMIQDLRAATNHGERSFFDLLRVRQPLKYQKAVKEFYKAVGF